MTDESVPTRGKRDPLANPDDVKRDVPSAAQPLSAPPSTPTDDDEDLEPKSEADIAVPEKPLSEPPAPIRIPMASVPFQQRQPPSKYAGQPLPPEFQPPAVKRRIRISKNLDAVEEKKKAEEDSQTKLNDRALESERAKAKARQAYLQNNHKKDIENWTVEQCRADGWSEADIERHVRIQSEKKEKNRTEGKHYIWITWNPKPDAPENEIFNAWECLLHRKGFTTHKYVVEKHASNGERIHFHALFKVERKDPDDPESAVIEQHQPARVKSACAKTLKDGKLFKMNPSTLHIKFISAEEAWGVLQYIKGLKTPPEKQQYVEQDRLWRESIGMAHEPCSDDWSDYL